MLKAKKFCIAVSLGTFALVALGSAQAQSDGTGNVIAAPDYDSGAAFGAFSDQNFNTPESDGRPGVKFFTLGALAFERGDFAHAIDMYKVAASWAYKPAEYNLGVMYFRGEGVPVNRPLGAAWMVLAAERGEPLYLKAQDAMVTSLTPAQFAETDELWGKLKNTYGDKVALRRAKAQWAWVRTHQTGTRVGGAAGNLRVGILDTGHSPVLLSAAGSPMKVATTAGELLQGGSIDGSIAYRQMQQSSDPYSPIFLKNAKGSATVGPLTPVRAHEKAEHHARPPASGASGMPTD